MSTVYLLGFSPAERKRLQAVGDAYGKLPAMPDAVVFCPEAGGRVCLLPLSSPLSAQVKAAMAAHDVERLAQLVERASEAWGEFHDAPAFGGRESVH